MKSILKRCGSSFIISAVCGTILNLLIELIVRFATGLDNFSPLSPEYLALFPSESIAIEVNILLYGIIGATFAGMTTIYEQDQIGFLFQNLLYYTATAIVWLPIVIIVWNLDRYWQALAGTLVGFAITYVIMSIIGYKITKRQIEQINVFLTNEQAKV